MDRTLTTMSKLCQKESHCSTAPLSGQKPHMGPLIFIFPYIHFCICCHSLVVILLSHLLVICTSDMLLTMMSNPLKPLKTVFNVSESALDILKDLCHTLSITQATHSLQCQLRNMGMETKTLNSNPHTPLTVS